VSISSADSASAVISPGGSGEACSSSNASSSAPAAVPLHCPAPVWPVQLPRSLRATAAESACGCDGTSSAVAAATAAASSATAAAAQHEVYTASPFLMLQNGLGQGYFQQPQQQQQQQQPQRFAVMSSGDSTSNAYQLHLLQQQAYSMAAAGRGCNPVLSQQQQQQQQQQWTPQQYHHLQQQQQQQ
jgi:hypothetical protein